MNVIEECRQEYEICTPGKIYKKRVCAVKKFCITKFFFSSKLSIARGWNSPVVSLCKFDVLNSTEA